MNGLASKWNKFKKLQQFSQLLSIPAEAILRGKKKTFETKNTILSRMHLFKKLVEEKMGDEFMKEKFIGGMSKICLEKCWKHLRTWLQD